jgi:MoxR-like ATPase
MVLATQNPIEYEGTFPLPEAQLDRFLLRIRLGYPSQDDEVRVLDSQHAAHPIDKLGAVTTAKATLKAQADVKKVHVAQAVKDYIVELVRNTRDQGEVYLGASPRGSLALYRASQARAAVLGRDFVLPDDVQALVHACLAHRIILGPAARLQDINAAAILDDLLNKVAVPGADLKFSAPK